MIGDRAAEGRPVDAEDDSGVAPAAPPTDDDDVADVRGRRADPGIAHPDTVLGASVFPETAFADECTEDLLFGESLLDGRLLDDELDGAGGSVTQEPTALESALAEAIGERDEYLESLRRLQADFENFRKRTQRQQQEVVERSTEALLERLLPVLDAFDLAVDHALGSAGAGAGATTTAGPAGDPGVPAEPSAELRPFVQIASLLRDGLAKEGLERVAEVGVAFDPTVHDAVAHVESGPDEPGGVVIDVMRPGYRLKGRVLRPAMVRVRG